MDNNVLVNKITIKKSIKNSRPDSLDFGELAISNNSVDSNLYIGDINNNPVKLNSYRIINVNSSEKIYISKTWNSIYIIENDDIIFNVPNINKFNLGHIIIIKNLSNKIIEIKSDQLIDNKEQILLLNINKTIVLLSNGNNSSYILSNSY